MNTQKPKRTVLLVRCSTDEQAADSIPRQQELLRAYAKRNGLTVIDEIVLDGVSASMPGYEDDLKPLLERAQRGEYDTLLFQSYDRFTRRGPVEGLHLAQQFAQFGVEILSATDAVDPHSKIRWLIEGLKFHEGHAYAAALSFATGAGRMRKILQGDLPHNPFAPYGIDRLYLSPSNVPLYVIRLLEDGTQLKLHPKTKKPLSVVRPDEKHLRHEKAKADKVVLIPGDPKKVEIVRLIFKMRYVDGRSTFYIARHLNKLGIPSPRNATWNSSGLAHLLVNETFFGVGVANQMACGVHTIRGLEQPIPVPPNTVRHSKYPWAFRPEAERVYMNYPQLRALLPFGDEMRDRILKQLKERRNRKAAGPIKSWPKSKKDSDYFLNGVLRLMPSGTRPYGVGLRNRGFFYRYYVEPTDRTKVTDGRAQERVRADVLEQKVIELLNENLVRRDVIEKRVRSYLNQAQATLTKEFARRQSYERQRRQILEDLDNLLSLGRHSQAILKSRREEMERRAEELEKKLGTLTVPRSMPAFEEVMHVVMEQSRTILAQLQSKSPLLLRQIVAGCVPRFEVNAVTGEVVLDIQVPASAMHEKYNDVFSAPSIVGCDSLYPTKSSEALNIAHYHLRLVRSGRNPPEYTYSFVDWKKSA